MMNQQKPSVIFFEQDHRALNVLLGQFKKDFQVFGVHRVADLFALVKQKYIHAVVCSQDIHETSGVAVLRDLRQLSPKTARILLTSYSDLTKIIDSIEEGEIHRYVTKPWHTEDLANVLHRATQSSIESQRSHNLSLAQSLPKQGKILLIDDCAETHDLLYSQFAHAFDIVWANDIDKTFACIDKQEFSVVITDVRLKGVSIISIIESLKNKLPLTSVLLLTRFHDNHNFANLINGGYVYRCLPKPVRASLLEMSVQRALSAHLQLKEEVTTQLADPVRELSDCSERVQSYITLLQYRKTY